MTTTLPLHIDSTMMTCFRSCPRKFWLEFACGYRPPTLSIDLHAGACFALALEVVYKKIWAEGKSFDEAMVLAHAAFMIAWGDFEIPEWKKTAKTCDRVWEAVESYFYQYAPLTDHVQPFFTADGKPTIEYTFAIPLEPLGLDGFPEHPDGGPFLYSGRFDLLGSYHKRPVPLDQKTTKGFSTNWAEQWDLRSQFIGYVWACRQCGIPVEEVCIRGIAILMRDIQHREQIKPYSQFVIDRWYEQLRRDMWRMRRSFDEGYFDFNLGDACTAYGNCTFLTTCQSPNEESWLSEFEIRHWNPLEKNPAKEAEKEAA